MEHPWKNPSNIGLFHGSTPETFSDKYAIFKPCGLDIHNHEPLHI